MNQDGFSSSEPVCIQVVNGKAYEVLQMQGMSEIMPSFNVSDVNLKEVNESIEESGTFRTNSHSFQPGGDFSENVLSVPMQFLHLSQNSPFFSNLPDGTQLQFDVDRKHGKLSTIEVVDKVSDEADIAFQSNGQVIISYNGDGSKNYLLDPNNLNMLIAENEEPNFVDEDNVNVISYEENDDSELLSGQLMVTKLVKEYDESDDVIPDSQTITINNNHPDNVMNKCVSESPSGWTCYKCNQSFNKWMQYKKHKKKHEEDRPYQCLICEESFNFEKNLNLHQSLHNSEELKCPECGKTFRRLAGFKAHLSIHQEEEIITCLTCGEEFISMFQLYSHHQDKHSSIALTKPNLRDYKVIKQEPETGYGNKMFLCQKCGTTCASGTLLKEHMLLHRRMNKLNAMKPKQKFVDRTLFDKKCIECGKCFLKPSQLLRHLRIHTGERPYKCTFNGCGRAFNQSGTLHIHMNIHSGKKAYVCELCNKGFIQKSNLRGHLRRVHPVTKGSDPLFSCLECPCVFRKANSLNAHISRAHMSDAYLDSEKAPDEYKSLIKQLQELDSHNGEVTANKISKVLSGVPISSFTSGPKKCPTEKLLEVDEDILQQALKNSGLEQGKESHILPDRSLPAKDVKPRKLHKVKMVTVIERMHEGSIKRFPVLVRIQENTKWYVCDFERCTKEFKKPSDLVRHIRTHTNERPYQCKKCHRAFSVKATLMGHMKTHSSEKEHSCNLCSKKFSTAANLRTHSWVHSGVKPYKCNECGKSFRTISHKKAHILSHTQSAHRMHALKKKAMPLPDIPLLEPILITCQGPVKQTSRFKNVYASYDGQPREDRPHICHFCQGAFKKSSHLKQHERIHTGEKPFKCELCMKAFGCRSILKSHLKIHTKDRNYGCNVCLKLFASKGSLTRHYSTHSSNRPYLCPYCHKKFKTNTNCKKHMKIHKQELAMEALRAAGFNLLGDSEQQAIMTTNVQEVTLRIAVNSEQEHPNSVITTTTAGKQSSIITFSSSEAANIMRANIQEFCKNSKESDSGSDSPVHIQATFPHDSLDTNFTLNDFQKKSMIMQESDDIQIITEPTCSLSSSQPSIILTSSPDYDDHTSKILINNPNELLCQQESNVESLEQPIGQVYLSHGGSAIMFENIEHLKKDYVTHPEISTTVIQKQNIVEHHGDLDSTANVESEAAVHRNINFPLHSIHSPIKNKIAKYASSFKLQTTDAFCEAGQQLCIDTTNKSIILSSEELQAFELNSSSEVTDQSERTIVIKEEHFQSRANEIVVTDVFNATDISSKNKENKEVNISRLSMSHPLLIHDDDIMATNEHEESLNFDHLPQSESHLNLNITSSKDYKLKENERLPDILKKRETSRKVQDPLAIKLEDIEDDSDKRPFKAKFPQNSYSHICGECGKAYQKYNNLKLHALKKHNTPTACKICRETFSSSMEMKKHLQIHKKKTCSLCKMQFSTSLEFIYHNRKVHQKESKAITDVTESGHESRKMWHCPVCQTLFASCDATQEHMITHSQEEISFAIAHERKQEMLIAKSCNDERSKLEMTSQAVDQLLQESSPDIEASNVDCKLQINPPHNGDNTSVNTLGNQFYHICNSCGKGFKKPSDLTRHIRTHTGEKPYECSICSKKFAVKSTLDVHKRIHTGRKEFKCIICKTLYSSKGSLKVHMRLHTGAKPLKCTYCGMKFRTSGHRKAHVAKHFKLKDFRGNKNEVVEVETITNPETMFMEDNILASSVDVNEEINSVMIDPDENSVMINPDGTVTLQINGLSLSGLEPSSVGLLNLPSLTDSVFDHVQFCSSESLEMQNTSVVEEVGENSLSVNPNVVMTRRDRPSDLSIRKHSIDDKVPPEENLSQEHNIIVLQNNASSSSRESFKPKNLSNIFIEHYFSSPISSEDIIQCSVCEKSFVSSKDLEEHMKAHGITKGPFDITDLKNRSLKSPSRMALNKMKLWKCPYPNCPLSFQSKKEVQCHIDNLHNVNYECSECKEVFLSRSFLQQHLFTDHCASKFFKCAICRRYFNSKEELEHHTLDNSECSLLMQAENCYIEKNNDLKPSSDGISSSKIILVDSVTRESLDEDSEPLMIRDIFLSQS